MDSDTTNTRIVVITSEDDQGLAAPVSQHFGRCPYVTLVEVEGDRPLRHWVERNPNAGLHQPGTMPKFIRALGASAVLSGGMGPRAIAMFQSSGIEVATGATGTVEETLRAYLEGRMSGTVPCEQSHDHHGRGCGHGRGPGRDGRSGG
jgi:predicted Fe-Mo cluster-binding NifX family protein